MKKKTHIASGLIGAERVRVRARVMEMAVVVV